ncbi:MAG: acyl-CoA dehydrogenase family protein [Acidimicrobiia bacterium]|nr:acyl-CoA dehydrogenase family protein [Acidimicrobiia bacterium]MDH4307032.1 acyl-CoA dehydrogenase family protein [Acidimicrobiia bacterium]MDH5293203.1 acyl-CoA dehydrogenase family protein [Acidimicrobiia bacterium]
MATAEVLEHIAMSDAASAWIVMIASTTSLNGAFLPEPTAHEVYADGASTLTAGVLAPKGGGVRHDAGYRISGTWPFCSGCLHADWITVGFIPDGEQVVRTAVVPNHQVEILDTWHVMGLAATGSHDIRLTDVYVPDTHTWVVGQDEPWSDEPLYRFPIYGMLALGVAAVLLGAARGAIADLKELASGKVPTGSRRSLADRPSVQEAVARSEMTLDAARCYLNDVVEGAWAVACAGDSLDDVTRARLRMAATGAAEAAVRVTESMYRAAGGTSIYRSSPLERRFRDVNTGAQHMMIAQPTWEVAGRVLLGLGGHEQL